MRAEGPLHALLAVVVICCVLDAASSTRAQPATGCAPGLRVETKLFFGTRTRQGLGVSRRAWDAFVKATVVPAFPDGFTVFDALGYWRGGADLRTARELSHVVIKIHGGLATDEQALERVITAYKARFKQRSVLRVDASVCASP